ncbi:MAG TPA: bifunctional class I SAM-dependent methyltransferase/glycosyltransferase family 2 protein [Polyangiaceae bacterium]
MLQAIPSPTLRESAALDPVWQEYFLRLLSHPLRFSSARRLLHEDLVGSLRLSVPHDAKVLEVGVGSGEILAGLPNAVRVGVDILPEAVARAKSLDSSMRIVQADALSLDLGERFDAIICDRLCHTIEDVQRLLERLSAHLTDDGRIFLTCFNFLWSVPLGAGERVGLKEPSPQENWFSEVALNDLFRLTDLEVVKKDDRLLMPARLGPVSDVVNRVATKLWPSRSFSLYRIYTLARTRPRRPTKPKVTVIVPARNEAGNIEAAVRRTPVMGGGTELIFVEGNSTDETWKTIQEVVRTYRGPLQLKCMQQPGKGKGDAVRTGFAAATGDILMILDADLTVQPEELPKFYDVLVSGKSDYVHGTRLVYPMEDEAMRFLNRIGNAFFAETFSFLLDQPIKDTLCGTKVLWKTDYERIAANRAYFGDFDPFGDFDLIFGAAKLNLRIMEIPIRYKARTYGETNISRFKHGLILLRMSAFAAKKIKFV